METRAKEEADKKLKVAIKSLDDKTEKKYSDLSLEEIKELLFVNKWMDKLETDLRNEIEQVLTGLSSKVMLIAKRYEYTLADIENKAAKSKADVIAALERMGYTW